MKDKWKWNPLRGAEFTISLYHIYLLFNNSQNLKKYPRIDAEGIRRHLKSHGLSNYWIMYYRSITVITRLAELVSKHGPAIIREPPRARSSE